MKDKIYRPGEEVCFECGNYFFSHNMITCKHSILNKIKLCRDCFNKKFDIDFKRQT